MTTEVVMPMLSLTMKVGTVGKWYRREGETIEKGEPLVEIISEKATYDLEAPASGTLRRILSEEGVDVPVNAVLAIITAPGETYVESEESVEAHHASEATDERILASPAAKRLARESGIDLSEVIGSGPDGRIVEQDVEKLLTKTTEAVVNVKEIIPLAGYRKTSAKRLSMSFRTAPHSTIMMEIDVSKAVEMHSRLQVSYTAILVQAVARALVESEIINSTLEGDKIKVFEDVNVGIAVATEGGLTVPVIHNADRKSVKEIDSAVKDLTERAKQKKLTREDIAGGTFTITNLGMYDVDSFTPIINPPEAAILGAGRLVEKPIAVNGRVEIKPMITLSLSYDHRILDGVPAAIFLTKVKERIEKVSSFEG